MSTKISLKVTQVMKGPTLRLTLAASCYRTGDVTSETFVIDDMALVRLNVKCVKYGKHSIRISTMKHKLVKQDAININVTCNALNYSEKRSCCDTWSDWIEIGEEIGIILPSEEEDIYLSLTEIVINVHNMTKPAFPMLYDDSELTDFTLSTPNGSVAVHKACLAAHSPVFKAMFTGTWKETKENLIEIKGYTRQTVQQLKDFLYLGTLPDDGLRPLITLAALYSISSLKKECARKLAETVLPEDLYSLHELACANNIPELSCAITQLTLDQVVDQGHQWKKKDEIQIKTNDENEKQTKDQ